MIDDIIKQRKTVFISAGHSDSDPGAKANGWTEANIVLELRDNVASRLAEKLAFISDGQKGTNLPLAEAAREASKADIAVEFHCNAAASGEASGTEALGTNSDTRFGEALCSAISGALGIPNRGHKPEGSGQHSRLAFVSDGGGIIVELFFLTNEGDLQAYRDNKGLAADEIADAIIEEAAQ